MKIPLFPVHILTTKNLAAKIESAKAEVEASHKEDRQKANKALLRLLHRNHQLASMITAQGKTIKEFRKGKQKDVKQATNRSGRD